MNNQPQLPRPCLLSPDLLSPKPLVPQLTESEQKLLLECETTINKGYETFLEIGKSLTVIRDKKLYRDTHATFDEYVTERWDFGKSQAYRLIGAAEIVDELSPIGDDSIPQKESVLRPLAKVEKGKRKEVLEAAIKIVPGGGKLTAKHVTQAVASHASKNAENAPRIEPPTDKARQQPAQAPRSDGKETELIGNLPTANNSETIAEPASLGSAIKDDAQAVLQLRAVIEYLKSQDLNSLRATSWNALRDLWAEMDQIRTSLCLIRG